MTNSLRMTMYVTETITIVYVLLELETCLLSLYSLVVYQTLGLRVLAIYISRLQICEPTGSKKSNQVH